MRELDSGPPPMSAPRPTGTGLLRQWSVSGRELSALMSDASPSRASELKVEQIRLLYANAGPVLGATVACALLLAVMMSGVVASPLLLSWLGYMLVVTAARAMLVWSFARRAPGAPDVLRWGRYFLGALLLTSVGWGAGGYFFYPDGSPVLQMFLAFVLGGVSAAGVANLAASRTAYLLFVLPVGVPICAVMVSRDTLIEQVMGALVGLFVIVMVMVSDRTRGAIVAALQLSFANRTLVDHLRLEVAQRERAERELRMAQEKLEQRVYERTRELTAAHVALRHAQKMEAVGRLAGGIAHDFNNVLTAIMGWSDLLWDELEPGQRQRDTVEEIRVGARRAATLVHQLLTFSRQQVVSPEVVDLCDLLARMSTLLARLVGDGIAFSVQHDGGPSTVLVDPGQIEQVLLNLVVNAKDATQPGGHIDVRTDSLSLTRADRGPGETFNPGTYVRIQVSDDGSGMDPETLSRVFEPFFTTKAVGLGTGLGLATVYGIVQQSGGFLRVSSSVAQGSTFSVCLPLVEAPVTQPSGDDVTETLSGHERILLVEDDDLVRRVARQVLAGHGYDVRDAGHARAALELISDKWQPDALVTDMVMPEVGGVALAEELRQGLPTLRVLYCSGYATVAPPAEPAGRAPSAFLQKPYPPLVLVRRLRSLLGA